MSSQDEHRHPVAPPRCYTQRYPLFTHSLGQFNGGHGGALQRNFGVFLVSVMPASLFSRHSQVFLRAERSHWLRCPNMAESDWMPPMASFLSLLRMFSAGNKATLRDYTGFITSKLGALLRGKWLLLLFRAFLHSYPQKCTAKLNIVTEAFHLFIFIDWRLGLPTP